MYGDVVDIINVCPDLVVNFGGALLDAQSQVATVCVYVYVFSVSHLRGKMIF